MYELMDKLPPALQDMVQIYELQQYMVTLIFVLALFYTFWEVMEIINYRRYLCGKSKRIPTKLLMEKERCKQCPLSLYSQMSVLEKQHISQK